MTFNFKWTKNNGTYNNFVFKYVYILNFFSNVNYPIFIKCHWLCLFGLFISKLKSGPLTVFYMVMGFLEEKVFFDAAFVISVCGAVLSLLSRPKHSWDQDSSSFPTIDGRFVAKHSYNCQEVKWICFPSVNY